MWQSFLQSIQKAKTRGRYCLNMKSGKIRQLMLDFSAADLQEKESLSADDGHPLALFE